jgi:hypothetical protein
MIKIVICAFCSPKTKIGFDSLRIKHQGHYFNNTYGLFFHKGWFSSGEGHLGAAVEHFKKHKNW